MFNAKGNMVESNDKIIRKSKINFILSAGCGKSLWKIIPEGINQNEPGQEIEISFVCRKKTTSPKLDLEKMGEKYINTLQQGE